MYKRYNPNPIAARVGDCTVRAISKATGQSWQYTYVQLCLYGLLMSDMPSANSVWGAYLLDLGFSRNMVPDVHGKIYTVSDFAREHQKGIYILALSGHVVAVVDGDWRASGTYGHDDMRMDDRGMSYANRGRHYVRGHYSRGGSREMNRCRDYLSDQIRDMMDRDDLSQTDRASLKRALEELQG